MTDERNVTPVEDAVLRAAVVRAGTVVAKGRMTDELPPLPEPDISGTYDGCMGEVEMRSWSAARIKKYTQACVDAAVERERERWNTVLFDGMTVLQHLDERAKSRTSYENVSDVLDAVAAAIRKGG